jgi:hypothetical protein
MSKYGPREFQARVYSRLFCSPGSRWAMRWPVLIHFQAALFSPPSERAPAAFLESCNGIQTLAP